MSLGMTSHRNHPDLDQVSASLLCADQRAGTGIAVEIDGGLRILTGAELERPAERHDGG